MAVLFVSHSSRDDAVVRAIEHWLQANGFDDYFVDHKNIAVGDNWSRELKRSAAACRAVIFLVTANWLASSECFGEFKAAWYMGKRLVPLFLIPSNAELQEESRQRLIQVRMEDQGLDLLENLGADGQLSLEGSNDVSERLRAGLNAAGANTNIGLSPEAFEVDRAERPSPFPGLASFGDSDADAALFYGRSREIAATLEIIRSMRALSERRPLMILGASGSGKSSLLKAGIIPRLRREAPAWLALRAFRPGADPLLNFAEALARTANDFAGREAIGAVRDRLLQVWRNTQQEGGPESLEAGLPALRVALKDEARRLGEAANRPAATVLLSVDQAEELTRVSGESSDALAAYLRASQADNDTIWQLVFTIRTDNFPDLQRHPNFQNLEARGYDLRSLPAFRFSDVVEEPAKRYGVTIDPALIDQLIADAPQDDSLPLLAFSLQRLWQQYAASGRISCKDYDAMGGIRGLIEDAAERAIRGMGPDVDRPLPGSQLSKSRDNMAARTFVPALAEIHDNGTIVRRVAKLGSFNVDQTELLDHFSTWRLVVHKGQNEGATVEVAHEAMFREWRRFRSWIEPQREKLEALKQLQSASVRWQQQARSSDYLEHRGRRLKQARTLMRDATYRLRLTATDRRYLRAAGLRSLRSRSITFMMISLFLILPIISIGLAIASREEYSAMISLVEDGIRRKDDHNFGSDRLPRNFYDLKDQPTLQQDLVKRARTESLRQLTRLAIAAGSMPWNRIDCAFLPKESFDMSGDCLLLGGIRAELAVRALGMVFPPDETRNFPAELEEINEWALLDSGDLMAGLSKKGTTIYLLDPKTLQVKDMMPNPAAEVHELYFLNDEYLIGKSHTQTIIWSVARKKIALEPTDLFYKHDIWKHYLAYLNSASNSVAVVDLRTGMTVFDSPADGAYVRSFQVQENRLLIETDRAMSVWDVVASQTLISQVIGSNDNLVSFSPDLREIVHFDKATRQLTALNVEGRRKTIALNVAPQFIAPSGLREQPVWEVGFDNYRRSLLLSQRSLELVCEQTVDAPVTPISRCPQDNKISMSAAPRLVRFDDTDRSQYVPLRPWVGSNTQPRWFILRRQSQLPKRFPIDLEPGFRILYVNGRLSNFNVNPNTISTRAIDLLYISPTSIHIIGDRKLHTWSGFPWANKHGSSFRNWLCSGERKRKIANWINFPEASQNDDLTNYFIFGRPKDPCEWKDINTLTGWQQYLSRLGKAVKFILNEAL